MARKSKVPVNMSAILQSTTGTLAQIQTKTNSLSILANIVRQICPDLPESAWHIANFREQTLVIEVKSPVWGQRLQFERNNICQALIKSTDNSFNQIKIKVNPHGFTQVCHTVNEANRNSEHTQDKPVVLSAKSIHSAPAKHLLEIAQNAPKGLKEKLEKLAKVAGK